MEGKCRKCGRLIYDVTDMDMLPNVLECQHCHHRNIIRCKPPVAPESVPETEPGSELAPEELVEEEAAPLREAPGTEGPSGTEGTRFIPAEEREESPGPGPEESAEEVD